MEFFVEDLNSISKVQSESIPKWAYHHRDQYPNLDLLEIPGVGRSLEIIGFVFTDPFDIFLRRLSEEYIAEAWTNLIFYLDKFQIAYQDLSWGFAHPGETGLRNEKEKVREPHSFIGWTSQKLTEFYNEEKFILLDEELKDLTPQLRFIGTWRSSKWRIAPTNLKLALKLIEAICTDDISYWSGIDALFSYKGQNTPWLKVIKAFGEENQEQLNLACEEAKKNYSQEGFRIVMLSLAGMLSYEEEYSKLHLPNLL